MKYVDQGVLALFIYLYFLDKTPCVYSCIHSPDNIDDESDNYDMKEFNKKLRGTIVEHGLENAFYFYHDKKEDGCCIDIELTNKGLLRTFLNEYLEEFKNDTLKGIKLLYEKQIEYLMRDIEYYCKNYGNTFKFESAVYSIENLPSKIYSDLRPYEFLLIMAFSKEKLISINCIKLRNDEDYYSGVDITLTASRSINEITNILKNEDREVKNYFFKKEDSGSIWVDHKMAGETYLLSPSRQKAFEYFLRNNNTKSLKVAKAIVDLKIKAKIEPIKTLKKYINEINTALREIHKPERKRERYITVLNDYITVNIPR